MLVGKSLLQSGTPERYFTQVGSGLDRKHQTRLEMPAWNKHSSLIGPFASYEEKNIVDLFCWPWEQKNEKQVVRLSFFCRHPLEPIITVWKQIFFCGRTELVEFQVGQINIIIYLGASKSEIDFWAIPIPFFWTLWDFKKSHYPSISSCSVKKILVVVKMNNSIRTGWW